MLDLVRDLRSLDIEMKEFLFFRRLNPVIELADGVVWGASPLLGLIPGGISAGTSAPDDSI